MMSSSPSLAAAAKVAEREFARSAERREASPDYRETVHRRAMAFLTLADFDGERAAELAEERAEDCPTTFNRDVATLARRRADNLTGF